MTNEEKAKITNKIIIRLIGADKYITQLKEAEQSKEAYKDIDHAEMVIDELVMLLCNLENQYFQSQ